VAREDIDASIFLAARNFITSTDSRHFIAAKHLFVEKPIAPSYTQALEMAHTARSHGLMRSWAQSPVRQSPCSGAGARGQNGLAFRRSGISQT